MSSSLIVIPCFNEAERLEPQRFLEFARKHENVGFLFVDDGSGDGTRALLEEIRDALPGQMALLALERNQGKAEAVRRGVLEGMEQAEYVGYWDADLATPLEAIPEFAAILDDKPRVELVFGARVQLLGRRIRRRATRHYLGRLFATVASVALRLPIYDTQCGAKLLRSSPGLRSLFEDPFRSGWIFDVELIARLIHSRAGTSRLGAREVVYEIPLDEWCDVQGSKLGPRAYFKAILDITRIWWVYLRPGARESRRPGTLEP